MRLFYIVMSVVLLSLAWISSAEATKQTPPWASQYTTSCANVRCGYGMSCIETPGGPVCQQQTVSCANVLCAQGNQCVETSSGPQCVPAQPSYPSYPSYPNQPSYPSQPTYPTYPQQSCAYGGFYQYGQLVCYPPPAWRSPYQYGWGHYYNPQPAPAPQPVPVPKPTPAPNRPNWHHWGRDHVKPAPDPGYCTMEYDPVCAEKPVVCVQAPCLPQRRTFSNSCRAKLEEYTVLYKGECQ